ncbi:MAG: DNA methyltransferase [Halopenitus sp.]
MTDEKTLEDLPQPAEETTVHPDELHVDGDNPNEQSEEMFGLLVENLRQKGWLGNAIVADTDGCIADGEHRWRAAQEIGLTEVPVKFYDIPEDERRLWRQELNKISGEHDKKRDALEYDFLLSEGRQDDVADLTDAADEDLDELLDQIRVDNSRSAAYEYDPEHNVYFEDCIEGMQNRVADDSVDLAMTDPPYGVDVDLEDSMGRQRDTKHSGTVEADATVDDAVELWDATVAELTRVCKPDAHLYCFASWKTGHEFREVLEDHGWSVDAMIVWVKNDANHLTQFGQGDGHARYGYKHEICWFATREEPRPIEGHPDDVYHVTEPRFEAEWMDRDVEHPTMKPVDLLRQLLENSTDEGDRVIDPFMGSGSTAIAAIQNDRDYVGFEVDEESYRTPIERRIGEAKRQRDADVNQSEAAD